MKHMMMTDEENKESEPALAVNKPKYPYGLEIRLDDSALKKLGIKELPPVGTKMRLDAKVHVSGAMSNEGDHGKFRSVNLQITHMDLGKGGEHESTDKDEKSKRIYGEKEK